MNTGDWAWCKSCQETCRIVAVESLWGQTWLRVWLTGSAAVFRFQEEHRGLKPCRMTGGKGY